MIEVAVVGAGTAGLVAARHLINAGLRPTIFDVAKTVGGAWTPPSSSSSSRVKANDTSHSHPARKMWNGLTTNLSKYTCRFSDWPWPEDASTFPSVAEMHDYLESYAECYLSDCNFQLECKVTNVEQLDTEVVDAYKVEWIDVATQTMHSRDFGGVVVATGFFHTPQMPSFLDEYNNRRKPQILHSSDYQYHQQFSDKKVAVIGSSFSALEIAADITKSASRVVNVLPSVPWVLPRWIPQIAAIDDELADGNDTAVTILPTDLVLYQRTQPFPQTPETTTLTRESCRERHEYLQSLVGQKQRNSPLGEPENWDEPPFVAISDEYLDLVREGRIEVVHGRLEGVEEEGGLRVGESQSISDIDQVVCCTGYTPQLHDFLSPSILNTLQYDQNDMFSPLTLAWDTLHPSLPNMAFCGMYRGPYMGIMDLQARVAAGVFIGSLSIEDEIYQSALEKCHSIRSTKPRAQFPHFDYTGYMDTLATLCSRGEYPKFNTNTGDVVVPSFYQRDGELAQKCKVELQKEIERGQDGSRMPKLVLQSILGQYTFDRRIVHLQTSKVERVSGTVKFSKYSKAASSTSGEEDASSHLIAKTDNNDNPVLYREDGLYEFSPTQKFEVFREYEYETKYDALDIYFVEGGKRTYLFLSLKFVPETSTRNADGSYWVKATSDHLCIKDMYSATFRVKMMGSAASEIVIKYRVKGPKKDYESTTILKPLTTI